MILLKGKKIAVVGVSNNEKKFGHKIFRDLLKNNLDVKAVGSKGGVIFGEKIYSKLNEIKEKIDIVVTVVPPMATEKIVEECIELGIKEIWMQPGSESQRAIEMAKNGGIKVTSHLCIMVQSGIW
ncbi:MAG: CoA-binding protein [Thermoanaerobaculaceae bacterium]|nr:CoA-binding protein [Thermoanaerobaculaceae bacterium]